MHAPRLFTKCFVQRTDKELLVTPTVTPCTMTGPAGGQEAVASRYYRKAAIYTRIELRSKEGGREGGAIKYKNNDCFTGA